MGEAREAETDESEEDPTAPLRRRLIVSALLSLPVLLLAMIEPLQFDNWQWLSLQLATPSCSGAPGRFTMRRG